jgi:hypothetical protein
MARKYHGVIALMETDNGDEIDQYVAHFSDFPTAQAFIYEVNKEFDRDGMARDVQIKWVRWMPYSGSSGADVSMRICNGPGRGIFHAWFVDLGM